MKTEGPNPFGVESSVEQIMSRIRGLSTVDQSLLQTGLVPRAFGRALGMGTG